MPSPPDIFKPEGTGAVKLIKDSIYQFKPDEFGRGQWIRIAGNIGGANGLALSPDENFLFVSAYYQRCVWRFTRDSTTGALSPPEKIPVKAFPDNLTVDHDDLYITGQTNLLKTGLYLVLSQLLPNIPLRSRSKVFLSEINASEPEAEHISGIVIPDDYKAASTCVRVGDSYFLSQIVDHSLLKLPKTNYPLKTTQPTKTIEFFPLTLKKNVKVPRGILSNSDRTKLYGPYLQTSVLYSLDFLQGKAADLSNSILAKLNQSPSYRSTLTHLNDYLWIPDSKIAREAEQECLGTSSSWIVNHSFRTYLFALGLSQLLAAPDVREFWGLGHRSQWKEYLENLYVIALLHDIGIESDDPCCCFAVSGGESTKQVALRAGVPWDRAEYLAEAVSLHITPGINLKYPGSLPALIYNATFLDLAGYKRHLFCPEFIHNIDQYDYDLTLRNFAEASTGERSLDQFSPHANVHAHIHQSKLEIAERWQRRAESFPHGRAAFTEWLPLGRFKVLKYFSALQFSRIIACPINRPTVPV
ncbi:MAG: hypothetical protein HC810_04445 [Acaryochloridaceae cyanobacterium RL_2_7]|nr:hypothetical protein [Acaryochloridaceae cyanobacterium RL_2_7]